MTAPTPVTVQTEDDEQRPEAIWREGVEEGDRRLGRGPFGTAATALVGGFDVMLGVAAATVMAGALSQIMPAKTAATLGAAAFGIGFVFITIGRSELFSENFLLPVGAVVERRHGVGPLLRTWAITLAANVAGLFVLAALFAERTVLDHGAVVAAGHTADVLADRTAPAAFLSAIAAGVLMTLWTWLSTAARTDIGRIAIAMLVGFAIAAPSMNHVIVGTGELMFGVLGGQSHASWSDVGVNFLLALAGNLVGGTLFVTLTRFVQARGEQSQSAESAL